MGWLPADNLLIFGTGGLVYGRVNANAVLNTVAGNSVVSAHVGYLCVAGPGCFVGSNSMTAVGWTLGAGAEYALTSNITVKAEYLYIDLGRGISVDSVALNSGGVHLAPSSFTAQFSTVAFNVVRAGMNYKF